MSIKGLIKFEYKAAQQFYNVFLDPAQHIVPGYKKSTEKKLIQQSINLKMSTC
jgi:hypothetical protein